MLRGILFSSIVVLMACAEVRAEEVKGTVSKIDEKSLTIFTSPNGETKTLTIAKDCKFSKQVKKVKEEIKDGVKADEFKNLPKKGLPVILTVNEKNEVTEVLVTKKKKI